MTDYIYLHGMILATNSFLLESFVEPDMYAEIKQKYRFPGGETGSAANVLSALGENVKMDGVHIGYNVAPLIKSFFKKVDLSSIYFDDTYEGLEDYVIIADKVRSPMGFFHDFYEKAFNQGIVRWNTPKEDDIKNCSVCAFDPYFGQDTLKGAEYAVKYHKPYVTIDCPYDGYLHQNASVSIISSEGVNEYYKGKTKLELFPFFQNSTDGLTIITNGAKPIFYGRKGEQMKTFMPYDVKVLSTLGAGDTFKAACVYGLKHQMSDDDLVAFACAASCLAISRFPFQLNPPTLEEIKQLINSNK